MENRTVYFEKEEGVVTVTLNRPHTNNTINSQMAAELADIRDEINSDSEIRAIIITGEGQETFSMGTDPEEERFSAEDRTAAIERLSVASIVEKFNQPVIAAINGDALGQGLELALACDLRICSEKARLAMFQVAQGRIPWDGGTQRLSRVVGKGKALEMVLLGETIEAQEAYRIGLVHRLAPPEGLMSDVKNIARKIAKGSPLPLKYAKEAIHKGMDLTLEQGLRLESDLYFLLHTTHDRTEGVIAFREKRKPRFKGR